MNALPRPGRRFLAFSIVPLWACASGTGSRAPAAQPASGAAAPVDWNVPADEAARTNPLTPSGENLDQGKKLFGRHCTACHGTLGRGDGPIAQQWSRLPKDLTNPERQARLTDGEIFWKISKGHSVGSDVIMPGLADKLGDEDRWRIVLHVRTLNAPR